MAVPGSGNSGKDPLQAYRLAASGAAKSDNVVRIESGSGEIKTSEMTWKEWFISWIPFLSGDDASREVSSSFQKALEQSLGKDQSLSQESREYLASGKPLTARKVASILRKEGLEENAETVEQNEKNWDAFETWFSEAFGRAVPENLKKPLRSAVASDLAAYERDLDPKDFLRLAGEALQNVLIGACGKKADSVKKGINPGQLLNATSQDALSREITDLNELREKAVLLEKHLSDLNDFLPEDHKDKQIVQRDLADVRGYIKQIDILLEPESFADDGGVFKCERFSDEVAGSLSENFTTALQAGGERYLDRTGKESSDGFLRAEGSRGGFGLDVNRATVSVNGVQCEKTNEQSLFENTADSLFTAFTKPVAEGGFGPEGKQYLKELSNVLGQGMIPTAIAAALKEAGVPSELFAKPSDQLSFDVRVEDGKVKVKVICKQEVHAAKMKDNEGVSYDVSIDEEKSSRSVELNFTFDPKPDNQSTITFDASKCSYSHKLAAKEHPKF